MARLVVLVIVSALAVTPAAALSAPAAQQQPVAEQALLQNQVGEQPAPAPQPVQPAVEDGRIGRGELLLIGLAIVVLLGAIWLVISRDARRATAGRLRTRDGERGSDRSGSGTRAARRTRRLSAAERQRRKRGRAR